MTTDWAALSDGQLWSRAVGQRDGDAFGQLFERHSNAVYNHCFRRTGSWSVAEDLTSVVFLEAWRKRRAVQLTGESVLPWLLAVANNATRNAERSRRRHQRLLARVAPPPPVPDFAEDAAQRADEERAMRLILDELRDLGEPEREVLALVDWAGLSYAETAAALGIPAGTVRSRLARARQQLRDRVAHAAPIATFTTTSQEDKR
jgi:RNA polymerase sigma factor (sigma-70 family)